ncbi:hypothetical protein AOLI_G00325910 [Acnodon oligacanthus]
MRAVWLQYKALTDSTRQPIAGFRSPWPAFLVVAVASSPRCIRGAPWTPCLPDKVSTLHPWRCDVALTAPPCAGGPSQRARTM